MNGPADIAAARRRRGHETRAARAEDDRIVVHGGLLLWRGDGVKRASPDAIYRVARSAAFVSGGLGGLAAYPTTLRGIRAHGYWPLLGGATRALNS